MPLLARIGSISQGAIRGAGGELIAQGFLTPEAALMVGQEVVAIAEAEATVELAAAISGAAMLDAAAAVAEAVQRDGTCWLGTSTLHGRTIIRISIVGWQTTADDVERSADAILAAVRAAVPA